MSPRASTQSLGISAKLRAALQIGAQFDAHVLGNRTPHVGVRQARGRKDFGQNIQLCRGRLLVEFVADAFEESRRRYSPHQIFNLPEVVPLCLVMAWRWRK